MAVLSDLSTLVGFETVSNRPVIALGSFLSARLEDLGFRVERFDSPTMADKCNIVASIGPSQTDGLVLSGHMDVVPTEGQPWSSDPFKLTERDGKLYARGSADMKGFFAATLQALARIRPAEYRKELVLIWTHDEEVGCLGSAQLASALKKEGRRLPSQCLIGEPTDFQILRMHFGHVAMRVVVGGKAAHSSRPDLGQNAIEGASRVISEVQRFATVLQGRAVPTDGIPRPWVPLNIATIHGGSAINIVPDHCTIDIGYRPLPGMASEAVFNELSSRLRAACGDQLLSTTILRATPSLLTEADTPLGKILTAHCTHSDCESASFATDGGNLAALGTQPLIFGPGSIEVAHQADEFVPKGALIQAVDILEAVVRERCCT
jgi:acetylornithine deacetylase